MASVRQYCNRAILVRDGKVEIDGSPEDVANSYSLENAERFSSDNDESKTINQMIKNLKVKLLSPKQPTEKDSLKIEITYEVTENIETYVGLTLWDIIRSQAIINSNSSQQSCKNKGKKKLIFEAPLSAINDTNIRVNVSIRDKERTILAYYPDQASPTIALHRKDYPDPSNKTTDATLFNRGKFTINES